MYIHNERKEQKRKEKKGKAKLTVGDQVFGTSRKRSILRRFLVILSVNITNCC